MRRWLICFALAVSCDGGFASAEVLYVNNIDGRDWSDGLTVEATNLWSGPVRTIRRALELAHSGDTLVIANTGQPYYESISLVGSRLSGVQAVPLTILGNGATLSGLRGLPGQAWTLVERGLWRVSFNRKGHYRLLRDGFALPEHREDDAATRLDTLPPGHWCAHRGAVYFRQDGAEEPALQRFDYTAGEVGISLYQVEHVRIVDLQVEHFRTDGINAQNLCRHITLENVVSRENGRAGLAVGGTSSVTMNRGRLERNGRFAALLTGKGSLETRDAAFDADPTVAP